MEKNKYKYLSKNILLFSISSFGQKILAFFLVPLYTSILSTVEYGIIDLVNTTVSLLIPIFTLSISEAVMRFTISDKNNKDFLTYGCLVIAKGTLLLSVMLLVAYLLPIMEEYKKEYIWVLLLFIANSVFSLQQNYLRAVDKVNVMVVASLLNSVVMMALNILLLVSFHLGITGYLSSTFVGLIVAIVFMEWKGQIRWKIDFASKNFWRVKKELLSYSIPVIFITLSWWVNSSLDKYFVTTICGVNQNGIYSIAYKIPTLLGVFATIFNQAWSLSSIQEFDTADKDYFFGNTYMLYSSMLALTCSVIMLLNIHISKFLYAKEFFDAWRCVPLLLVAALFSALSGFFGGLFSAVKDTKIMAYSTVVSAIFNIVLNAFFIPRMGIVGAALATAIAYFVSWLTRILASRKYIKIRANYIFLIITYMIVFVQSCLAMTETHVYMGQIILIVVMIIINLKIYVSGAKQIVQKIISTSNI